MLWKEFINIKKLFSFNLKEPIEMDYLAKFWGYRNSGDPRFQGIMNIFRNNEGVMKENLVGKGNAQGKEININRKELIKLLKGTEYYEEVIELVKIDKPYSYSV